MIPAASLFTELNVAGHTTTCAGSGKRFGWSGRRWSTSAGNPVANSTAALSSQPSADGVATTRTRHPARIARTATSCARADQKSTRLNSSHVKTSYAVFCFKKKKIRHERTSATQNKEKDRKQNTNLH